MCNLHIYNEATRQHHLAMSETTPQAPAQQDVPALQLALNSLLEPLARLLVARGMPYAQVEETLKRSYVRAAQEAVEQHAGDKVPAHRRTSRISTMTGINRREVTRLSQLEPADADRRTSVVSEVFTRWITHPDYRDAQRQPLPLPRLGESPSFESLAQGVTRDVHPRSILDELCRLGMTEIDETRDQVRIARSTFVPQGDQARMLRFLGDNTGDHLRAAVSNVLSAGPPPHFEQSVFSDDLSAEAMPVIRALVERHWQMLLDESIPLLERLIEDDRRAGRLQNQRVRIGLFQYFEPQAPQPKAPPISPKEHP